MHFWVGSFCGITDNYNRSVYPTDRSYRSFRYNYTYWRSGNQIPDKSWMLYLLEIFNSQNIASELNLICQFDNQDYFEAIFDGVNRYRFKQVLPIVSHSYLRQIIMNSQKFHWVYYRRSGYKADRKVWYIAWYGIYIQSTKPLSRNRVVE